MTAAPMIACAAAVLRVPISFRTFAVIAMLVAVSAVPTNTAGARGKPHAAAMSQPVTQGTATPALAIRRYRGRAMSSSLNSRPTTNSRKTAPRCATLATKSV